MVSALSLLLPVRVPPLCLIDTDTGIVGMVNGSEEVGLFKPQTDMAVSTTSETFVLGSQLVADGKVANASGVVTLAMPTPGNLAGKLDVELPASPFEISG